MNPWAKAFIDERFPSEMAIGKKLKHPSGRTVKIVAGKRWGRYGLSNFWAWREVKKNGRLGPIEEGYGWC